MQLPVGTYYHRTLETTVEVNEKCIAMSILAPMDRTSTFIELDDDILEVTEALLDVVDWKQD